MQSGIYQKTQCLGIGIITKIYTDKVSNLDLGKRRESTTKRIPPYSLYFSPVCDMKGRILLGPSGIVIKCNS